MSSLIAEVRAGRRLPSTEMRAAIRRSADVTQVALARELRVHPVTVARWEAGTREPRGELRRRYVELLDALRAEVGA